MKRFVQAILFYALLPWLYLIAILPGGLIYGVSNLLYYLVYPWYRRSVVRKNLTGAFPNKSERELKALERSFYNHFCDLLVEYIKSLTVTPAQVARRCTVQNVTLLERLHSQGRHIMLVAGHQGNWEWAASAIALQTSYHVGVIYKPLSNPYFDQLVKQIRQRFGKFIIHEKQILRTMLQYDAIPKATAFLADQAPTPQHVYVMQFLNQPTYVTASVEKLATKLNQAIVYVHIRKATRGYYTLELELLVDDPEVMATQAITHRYIQLLEADIRQQPATWLWSHNRWKDLVK